MQLNINLIQCVKLNTAKYNYALNYCTHREIAAAYQPKAVENDLCHEPLQSKLESFSKDRFNVLLPPPNVTGKLHLGHALMCTVQDVLVRWKNSEGYTVNWVPGTDHAGIATQLVVEKYLSQERGLSRHSLGRDRFLEEVWRWKSEKGSQIKNDLKRMGTSLNWENEYFTMDENQSNAVRKAFIQLFDDNLIYRSDSLINWSCTLESAISDIEVETIEITKPTALPVPGYAEPVKFGELHEIAYKLCGHDGEIIVSTTRPETILGDVAVAVHPDDARYAHLKEKQPFLMHPFRNERIPLVFDADVDPAFGSGAVKITPAHDKFDFNLAKRHSLNSVTVITETGLIGDKFGPFSGLKRFDARDRIKDELSAIGLYRGCRAHKMILPMCSRSKDVIEYLLKPQWFVRCNEMGKNAIKAVDEKQMSIYPEHFENDWRRWLGDVHDWCVSRQVWWGHRIPAYKCTDRHSSIWVAANDATEAREKSVKLLKSELNQISIEQDTDVLDTWFSSALLPFSAFGWPPANSAGLKDFFPLSVMCTGHDILFFWVARMVMLSQQLMSQVPFKHVVLHGILCDAHGRKMSKSLGNVIYPEHVIGGISLEALKRDTLKLHLDGILSEAELNKSLVGQEKLFPNGIPECGVDALRYTLCSHNIKNHFINFDVNECHANKLFFNKIWQATRYTLMAHSKLGIEILTGINGIDLMLNYDLTLMDKWILGRLCKTVETVDTALAEYNFHFACSALRSFFYGNLCDVYLETTKSRVANQTDPDSARAACVTLKTCLTVGLNRMKYFTPYLCTELLRHMPNIDSLHKLHISQWLDEELEARTDKILNICQAIRQCKSDRGITKKHCPKAYLFFENDSHFERALEHRLDIQSLTLCEDVILCNGSDDGGVEFVAKSTAGHMCTFGIHVAEKNEALSERHLANEKKLFKLEIDLNKLLVTVSREGYKKAANKQIQEKHLERIKQLQREIIKMKAIQS